MYSTLLRIALRVSTCIIHNRGLKVSIWSVIDNDLGHLGGYIYSIGLVKAVSESLQVLVHASSLSMLVTLNNVKRITSRAGMRNRTSRARLPI